MTSEEFLAVRVRLGMTQGELARALGWTSKTGRRHIRRFEKGEEEILPHVEERIRNLCQEEA